MESASGGIDTLNQRIASAASKSPAPTLWCLPVLRGDRVEAQESQEAFLGHSKDQVKTTRADGDCDARPHRAKGEVGRPPAGRAPNRGHCLRRFLGRGAF